MREGTFKVEIFLEQREVSILSPSKICENLNFSRKIFLLYLVKGGNFSKRIFIFVPFSENYTKLSVRQLFNLMGKIDGHWLCTIFRMGRKWKYILRFSYLFNKWWSITSRTRLNTMQVLCQMKTEKWCITTILRWQFLF